MTVLDLGQVRWLSVSDYRASTTVEQREDLERSWLRLYNGWLLRRVGSAGEVFVGEWYVPGDDGRPVRSVYDRDSWATEVRPFLVCPPALLCRLVLELGVYDADRV